MVEYTVRDLAQWDLPMDLPKGAPDTTNPEVPSAGTVRPSALRLGIMPNEMKGEWDVSSVGVHGPKVKDGKVVTQRAYSVMFTDPLGPESVAPDWVREICQEWVDKANGRVKEEDFGELPEEPIQSPVIETPGKTLDERFEEARELMEAGRRAKQAEDEKVRDLIIDSIRRNRSAQRLAFDTVFNALLTRTNLDGTEWAIKRMREEAEASAEHIGAGAMGVVADWLESQLDKRTAELAAQNEGI
jgi:hypothetical protein